MKLTLMEFVSLDGGSQEPRSPEDDFVAAEQQVGHFT